jgi:hypothetical protein
MDTPIVDGQPAKQVVLDFRGNLRPNVAFQPGAPLLAGFETRETRTESQN